MDPNSLTNPIVSVVMPVRNMERFLAESIESILCQEFCEFELIIVDFGSTDDSKTIASRYAGQDERVRLHDIPECGLAEARNAGAAISRGKYIAIQDADDLSLPNRLALEVSFLESHPEFGLLGGLTEWVDSAGKRLWVPYFPTSEEEIKSVLVNYFPFCHTSLLICKEVFDTVGGYRPVMTQSHDYDLALRVSERYRCICLPQIVVKYRVHPYQVSLTRRRKQSYCKLAAQASAAARKSGRADPLLGVSDITPLVLKELGITEEQIQRELASGYETWIEALVSSGDRSSALQVARESLQLKWTCLERARTANLYLRAAQLSWESGKSVSGLLMAFRVVLIHPPLAIRFVKSLGRRLGMVERRSA